MPTGDRPGEDLREIAARGHQAGAQFLLGQRPEQEADQERGERHPREFQRHADQAERQHDPGIERPVVQRVGADHAEHQDRREQPGARQQHHPGEQHHPDGHEHEHHDMREQMRGDDGVHHLRALQIEQRARLEIVDGQRAEQDGVGQAAGNAEREQRDQAAAGGRVVRGLGGDDGFFAALAELLPASSRDSSPWCRRRSRRWWRRRPAARPWRCRSPRSAACSSHSAHSRRTR